MLFNSYAFIFLFLPITLLVFFWLGKQSHALAAGWLTATSLFFYGWWNPAYVGLLLVSIGFNYTLGIWIAKMGVKHKPDVQKRLLFFAIATNILLLCYFKYANFFIGTVNELAEISWNVENIVLPLGISFFTFTQIAFLVDTYQGKVKEYNFVHYGLFVTYFPHLIAGPVLHHKEMMPQFAKAATYKFSYENIAVGLTIFFIGLFKKVVFADGVAVYVAPLFDASSGVPPTFIEAWGGALAYTFQLYFDFSGYSDMAIGLSRMFGVILPLNFHSPYKAVNIIDFWRRWHMTLSRFLRDYLYIPLGGNRNGPARRYINLMATMLLGGLWHGAGWTFVIWGGLHGIYLIINHGWHVIRGALGDDLTHSRWWGRTLARVITFAAIVVSWVFFRAGSYDASLEIIKGMMGMNGFLLPESWLPKLGWGGEWLAVHGVEFGYLRTFTGSAAYLWIALLAIIAWFMPNTQQIMAGFNPALDMPHEDKNKTTKLAGSKAHGQYFLSRTTVLNLIQWQPTMVWATVLMMLATWSLFNLTKVSEFLYFQF